MLKKALLYTILSLAFSVGTLLQVISNGFLGLSKKIMLVLDE